MVRSDLGSEISFQEIEHLAIYSNKSDAKERLNNLDMNYDSFGEGDFKLYLNYRSGLLSQSDAMGNKAFGLGYINKSDLSKIKKR